MLINYQTILIDRITQIVLGSDSNVDLVKLVSSSIFDTFVICLPKNSIPEKLINLDFRTINQENLKYIGGNKFDKIKDCIDIESEKKQKLFLLRKFAAQKLLDRIEITSTSFDFMSDLNVNDIMFYELYKEDFVNLYSSINGCDTEYAKKHLELVNQSNKMMLLKKYDLLWKYTPTLKNIINKDTLEKWTEQFQIDTVTAYRI